MPTINYIKLPDPTVPTSYFRFHKRHMMDSKPDKFYKQAALQIFNKIRGIFN